MQLSGFQWPEGGTKQVAYMNEEGHIHEMYVSVGHEWREADLTELVSAPRASDATTMVGYAWSERKTKQIAYMDRNHHIQELSVGIGGNWEYHDLTMMAHAPLADGSVLTAFSWEAGHTKQVVFLDSNYHVQELHMGPNGNWQVADLTALTNAPLADGASMIGFEWPVAGTKQIGYIDHNGHIQELSISPGGQWRVTDLTALTNAPLADLGNLSVSLTGCAWAAGKTKQFIYRDRHGHIQELFVSNGSNWRVADLTALTNASPANSLGGLCAFEWPEENTKQVAFVDGNYHMCELYVSAGNAWQMADLTNITHAPRVLQRALAGFSWSAGHTKQIVYVGPHNSIQELSVTPGGQWQVANLTVLVSSLMLV
jgi:hypothetical protein